MTNYLGQSLICAVLFYGFGLYDRLGAGSAAGAERGPRGRSNGGMLQ